jgi:tetratricopeptide (TPR) repeat protein/O-antigen ligase
MDKEQKISVRVGKARVFSRKSGSMDMLSDKDAAGEEQVIPQPDKPAKPRRSWFAKKTKKATPEISTEPEAPVVEAKWCDNVIRVLLHIAIIGIPLLFLPFTFEVFELSKQTLLYGIAILLFLIWLIKIITEKRVTLVKTMLAVPILVFLGVSLLSTLLSQDVFTGFFGFYGRFNGGFVQYAALAIIFFVIINNAKTFSRISEYLKSFVLAYLILLVFGFLQIFGVFLFPWDFAQISSFNFIGASLTTLAIFLAAGLGVVVSLMLKESGWMKALLAVISIAAIVFMFLTDIRIGWIGLIAAMVMIFALVVMRMDQFKGKATSWLPLVFLAVAVAFMLIPVGGLFNLDLPVEISLGRPVSWDITKATLSDQPIVGSGPETFFQDFNAHRPVQFNDSIIWSMRFDKAGIQLLQDMSTLGILGIIALGAIVIAFVVEAMKTLAATKEKDKWLLLVGPFAAWISLIVISFFYFFNTSLFFVGWLMLALGVAGIIALRRQQQEKVEIKWSFAKSPQVAMITSFIFLIILIGGMVSFYYISQMYVADMNYRNSQEKMLAGEDFEGAANDAMTAARLNGKRSVYHRGAAQALMAIANQEAVKENPDVNLVSNNVGLAIDAARTAQATEPTNVVNYEFLAGIYQNAGLYVRGADEWVIEAYGKAIELDPNNPILWNNLGKAYVIKSDRILLAAAQDLQEQSEQTGATAQQQIPQDKRREAEEALNIGIEKFNKATELKQEYFDAHLSLAQTYDKKGDREQAIKAMQIAVALAPQNPDALYELGRVYYNNEDYKEAKKQFEAAIAIFANHSNSLYSLGLVYLQENDKPAALEKFKKVLELNPDNADVQEKIDELEGRRTPAAEPEINADLSTPTPENIPAGEELDTGRDLDEVVEETDND